jgi:hypothetical protein
MAKKYYPLGPGENGPFVKVLRIIFGSICVLVAIYWLIFSPAPVPSKISLYVVICFLTGFGLNQLWLGLGKPAKFIEFDEKTIRLKKNTFLHPAELNAADFEKIQLYPMSTIFYLKTKKRCMLRFGATYQETNETIKDELIAFSDTNNIPLELIEEKI